MLLMNVIEEKCLNWKKVIKNKLKFFFKTLVTPQPFNWICQKRFRNIYIFSDLKAFSYVPQSSSRNRSSGSLELGYSLKFCHYTRLFSARLVWFSYLPQSPSRFLDSPELGYSLISCHYPRIVSARLVWFSFTVFATQHI